ncbi:hypothetical protein [Effusibacillus consociatus]|uniref:hypothetical protein n=1 Tax=Effusibacillus consociatus TaxID=1117041 RepID=UPI0036D32288
MFQHGTDRGAWADPRSPLHFPIRIPVAKFPVSANPGHRVMPTGEQQPLVPFCEMPRSSEPEPPEETAGN